MPDASDAKSGGHLIVDALRAHGTDAVFCVPGESYLAVLDGFVDTLDETRVITCRHEHGAANMAEAHAKLTGRTGVCLVTRGPGACNASIGVHTAFQDSTPMILLVGQVQRAFAGREAVQEVDFERMFAPLAKWAAQIETAADVPETMARAFLVANSGRPGPVVLALPEDMLRETSDAAPVAPRAIAKARPGGADMERLRRMLIDAERPFMIVGGGGWTPEARRRIQAFAEAVGVPVCCSFRRHHLFDNASPVFVGEMGIGADPALVERFKGADLVVAVGARLGQVTTQNYTLLDAPKPAQSLVHVHADADELDRVFSAELCIHAGMDEFTEAAAGLAPVDAAPRRAWTEAARADYEAGHAAPDYGGALDLGRVMTELDRLLPADAVVTVDAGNFSGWPQRFLTFGGDRMLLGATSGAMGYAVPAAIAAKVAAPARVVVACVGDGGFGMTGQELATAALHKVAPLVLLFNNRMFGTIRMHQERQHPDRAIATALENPDFAALAETFGGHGEVIARTEQFVAAFERALASGRASVLELRMDPDVITTRTTLSAIRSRAERV
jgi:acetolactate synthase-1/2/3 large subunit